MKCLNILVFLLYCSGSMGHNEIRLKEEEQNLILGKWDLYESCVYEANFCTPDTTTSIVFTSTTIENKIEFTILTNKQKIRNGIVNIYIFKKNITDDKFTMDNFLFLNRFSLIISFLDNNTLCLLQDSKHGYAKHFHRDLSYKGSATKEIDSQ